LNSPAQGDNHYNSSEKNQRNRDCWRNYIDDRRWDLCYFGFI